jgi:hypothetical protein
MALLACSRSYWQTATMQEYIDEATKTQQVIWRADELRRFRAAIIVEVCPFSGNQRFTSIRENKQKLQGPAHAGLPQKLQRLSFKGVVRTNNCYSLREVLMVGSVSRCPSIK